MATLPQDRTDATLRERARGGDRLEAWVEVACGTAFGQEGAIPLRTVGPALLEQCELAAFDADAWELAHDFAILQALEAHLDGDLEATWRGRLLHELNRFCTTGDRAILRELLATHNAAVVHELSDPRAGPGAGRRPRRPAGARGLPLDAGRRRGPAEHQRVAVPAAGRRGATRSPPSWRRSSGTATRTARPRRCATAIADWHGVRPDQVFAANGSNEVLQTLLLTYAGPGRTVVTFEPTYQLHAHIARITGATVVEGERGRRLHARPGRGPPRSSTRPSRRSRSCARRTTRPAWSRSRPMVRRVLDVAPGLVVVDEAYAQFADWSALDLRARGPRRSSSCARSPRRGAWRRPASATSSAPSWLVAELEKVVLPYHLDAAKQVAGRLALRLRRRDGRPGASRSSPSASGIVAALGRLARRRVPQRRQLRAVPVTPRPRRRPRRVAGASSTAACSSATARAGPASTDCLRVTIGTPAENDRFLAALGGRSLAS